MKELSNSTNGPSLEDDQHKRHFLADYNSLLLLKTGLT